MTDLTATGAIVFVNIKVQRLALKKYSALSTEFIDSFA
jgi:hypothetical protein